MAESSQDRIGAYRLVRRLAVGGMGEVFLAWDDRLQRPVAVKRMRLDQALDGARRERFRREARAAAKLSHPHVVQVFDLVAAGEGGATDDWIVMEHVPGRPVSELLRDGPLPAGVAVELGRQVAEALAAAHAQGLIHRDLKGENVMVTPAGQAKVLDFGLARPLEVGTGETLTDDGAILGTYRSMAPEQARGEPASPQSDLFSLGVLLYEMLTGTSPFQGPTPLETLRQVEAASPRPLAELRPDLSPALGELLETLLAREPERRPASAGAAALALRRLAERPELAHLQGWTPGFPLTPNSGGDLSGMASTLLEGERPSPDGGAPRRRLGTPRIAALTIALAIVVAGVIAGLGAGLWDRLPFASQAPLRVAVPQPAASGTARDELDLATSNLTVAALRTLLSLEGVTAIDPAQIGGIPGGATQAARAVGADEALAIAIADRGPSALITLRRVRARDGAALWAEAVEVPTAPKDALVLASAVSAALHRAYPAQRLRPGTPDLGAGAADYAEFLRIKRRLDGGRAPLAPELERLGTLLSRSPRFLDAHLLAASLALNLYQDSRSPTYLVSARASLDRARALAPGYPTLLAATCRLAAIAGDWNGAERALAELERQVPGDVLVPLQRAQLAERRGRLAEAVSWMREVVRRQPAWRDLLALATLESRSGDVAAARRHLEQLLAQAPGNTWGLAKLGELELLYGDLERAAALYGELVRVQPQRSDLTNLGLVQFLLGRFDAAAANYRQALALQPGHLVVTLNLADAELALGHGPAAAELYAQVLRSLERKEREGGLQPVERTIEAQCLARQGEGRRAVALALDTLQKSPQEAEVAYQAALVLSLAGDRASALALARQALRLGVQPRWFGIPGFEGLRAELSRP